VHDDRRADGEACDDAFRSGGIVVMFICDVGCACDVVRFPPVTGITADATGNLYFSAMTEDGVPKMGPDRKLQTLIRD
jgi:hypothetical protein